MIASSDEFDDTGQIQPRFPAPPLLGDVVVGFGHQRHAATRVTQQRLMADNDDVASVAAAMAQFAGPCLALQQLLVERVQRLRKLRA